MHQDRASGSPTLKYSLSPPKPTTSYPSAFTKFCALHVTQSILYVCTSPCPCHSPMWTPIQLSHHCQHFFEFFPTSSIYRAHSRYSQASSAWDRLHARPNNIRLLKFLVTHMGFPTRHQLIGFLLRCVIALTSTVPQHPSPRVLSLDMACLNFVDLFSVSNSDLVLPPTIGPAFSTSLWSAFEI